MPDDPLRAQRFVRRRPATSRSPWVFAALFAAAASLAVVVVALDRGRRGGGQAFAAHQWSHLPPGATTFDTRALVSGVGAPPVCARLDVRALRAVAPLSLAFDCLCFPAAALDARPSHCRLLLLQTGDFGRHGDSAGPSPAAGARPPLHSLSHAAVSAYAALHGYAHLFVDLGAGASLASDRAPAWLKVPLIHALAPYFDFVVFVDSDVAPGVDAARPLAPLTALLMSPTPRRGAPRAVAADAFFNASADVASAGPRPLALFAGNAPSGDGPCTGFFIVRGYYGGAPGTAARARGTGRRPPQGGAAAAAGVDVLAMEHAEAEAVAVAEAEAVDANVTRLLRRWWTAPDDVKVSHCR